MASNPRYEWFQNENYITVEVFVKQNARKDVKVEFGERHVRLAFVRLPGDGQDAFVKNFSLSHDIDPSSSSFKELSTKIEIKCQKSVCGIQWGALEGEDTLITGQVNAIGDSQAGPPAYPSSSKKKTNFNQLEKEIEKDKDPNEENALNSLFQKIYKDGTEETRRAMVKSFVESGGTTLSTNWDEVKQAPVVVRPPDGMEPRKYEG